jgi:hypothetical protein
MESRQLQPYQDLEKEAETVEGKLDRLQRLADYYGNELYKLNRQFSELTLLYGQLFYAAKVSRGYLPKPIYDPALEKPVTRDTGLDAFLEYHATEEERENRKYYEEQK